MPAAAAGAGGTSLEGKDVIDVIGSGVSVVSGLDGVTPDVCSVTPDAEAADSGMKSAVACGESGWSDVVD